MDNVPARSSLRLALVRSQQPATQDPAIPNTLKDSGVTKKRTARRETFSHFIDPNEIGPRIQWKGSKGIFLCGICLRGFTHAEYRKGLNHRCENKSPLKYVESQITQTRQDDSPFGKERTITIRQMACSNCDKRFDFESLEQFFHMCQ